MILYIQKRSASVIYRTLSVFICLAFMLTTLIPPQQVRAQVVPAAGSVLNLPVPGTLVPMTPAFQPAIIKGLTIHPEKALQFDFIVGTGDSGLEGEALKDEAQKLIKYFMAALTVPEEDMWVNLSPYESDRIVSKNFGDTEMGRDLLAQDYLLKQLSASLMYPEDELGENFWDRVHERAFEEYGTTEIPMNTFNKIWIVPEKATVYEQGQSVYVVESGLDVMLEEDYVALQEGLDKTKYGLDSLSHGESKIASGISFEIVREILIPEIKKEVNEGKIFANLRQIYNSMILAAWYKSNLKDSLLGHVYADKSKTKGVDTQDKDINQKIYNQYVESFKKGVYDYIREDYDPTTQQIIPRKYFSGGFAPGRAIKNENGEVSFAMISGITKKVAAFSILLTILGSTTINMFNSGVNRVFKVNLLGQVGDSGGVQASVIKSYEEIGSSKIEVPDGVFSRGRSGEYSNPFNNNLLSRIKDSLENALRIKSVKGFFHPNMGQRTKGLRITEIQMIIDAVIKNPEIFKKGTIRRILLEYVSPDIEVQHAVSDALASWGEDEYFVNILRRAKTKEKYKTILWSYQKMQEKKTTQLYQDIINSDSGLNVDILTELANIKNEYIESDNVFMKGLAQEIQNMFKLETSANVLKANFFSVIFFLSESLSEIGLEKGSGIVRIFKRMTPIIGAPPLAFALDYEKDKFSAKSNNVRGFRSFSASLTSSRLHSYF